MPADLKHRMDRIEDKFSGPMYKSQQIVLC